MRSASAFVLVVASMFLTAGCKGSSSDSSSDGGMFILANFQLVDKQGTANASIQDMADESWVNDATVTINDEVVDFAAEGTYQKMKMTGTFATGTKLDLEISSSLGDASASGTIPESGTTSVDISGAVDGSVFNISH
jgi:hypothetical protein